LKDYKQPFTKQHFSSVKREVFTGLFIYSVEITLQNFITQFAQISSLILVSFSEIILPLTHIIALEGNFRIACHCRRTIQKVFEQISGMQCAVYQSANCHTYFFLGGGRMKKGFV
jgi:hypothetical protein